MDVCPTECIEIKNDKAVIDDDACGECGVCVDECPEGAITLPE